MGRPFLWWFVAALLVLGAASAQPGDRLELTAFLDEVMTAHLEAYAIPGAVVAVVQDGEVAVARGYGYADIENRIPVDPETTLFRTASVTKLFTYTAIMQLVEDGRLDLDASVNEYLEDVRVPDTFEEAVTLRHLLTHTAGFEDVTTGLFAREPEAMRPLGDLLAERLPARIRPPGTLSAYSNYGAGLLGLVVEQVTGTPWHDAIERTILEPLGMAHTTGRQPLPSHLVEDAAVGYRNAGGRFLPQPFNFVLLAPGHGMSASGADMARFMLAHLQDGRLASARILEDATAQRMRTNLFRHDDRLGGMAYGFGETRINGERIVGHNGNAPNFITNLWLLPEHDLGVFVSYNSAEGTQAQAALVRAFMDRYFPLEIEASTASLEPGSLQRLVGTYLSTRIVLTGENKLGNLGETLIVRANDDGTLHLTGPAAGPMQLEALEPDLFQDTRTGERVVFSERDGVRHVFIENQPAVAYTALPWYETPQFFGPLMLAMILILLSTFVFAAIAAVVHRRRRDHPPAFGRWARAAALVMSLLFLGFIGARVVTDSQRFEFGTPGYLEVAGAVLPLGAVAALVVLVLAVLVWLRKTWNVAARLHYSLVALAGAVLVWQFAFWNELALPWGG